MISLLEISLISINSLLSAHLARAQAEFGLNVESTDKRQPFFSALVQLWLFGLFAVYLVAHSIEFI